MIKTISNKERSKILASLEEQKQFIAFEYPNGPLGHTIIVSQISSLDGDKVLCYFFIGHSGESHYTEKKDIIAIADQNGDIKLSGWHGHYIVLKPEVLNERDDGSYELVNEGHFELSKTGS